MTDIIQQAIARANGASTAAIESARNQATAAVSDVATTVRGKLPELPIEKDPILAARQAEARAQALRAEAKEQLLTQKQQAVEKLGDAKSKVAGLARAAASAAISTAVSAATNAATNAVSQAAGRLLGAPNRQALGTKAVQAILTGKVPKVKELASAKIAAALNAAEKAKEVAQERQAATVANLEKSTELFKFPLKPVVPEIPRPTIPSLPPIPDLPIANNQNFAPIFLRTPSPSPTASTTPQIPAGISEADWRRFGNPDARDIVGDDGAVREALAAKQRRREQIIKIQEERVRKAKEFVDRQAQRLASDPSLQSSYDTAVRVYNQRVAYLQKVRSDASILDLAE